MRDFYNEGGVRHASALVDYNGDLADASTIRKGAEAIATWNNRLFHSVRDIPRQWERDVDAMRDPIERKLLMRAFVDDALLTDLRRKSIVSILLWSFLLMWAVTGTIIAIAARPALPNFQAIYTLFGYGIATSLFLPLPFETLLTRAQAQIGIPLTVLVASVSKVVGAWIVLLMGDRAGGGIEQILRRFPRLRSGWRATIAWAQRYGYAAVFGLFVIPFMSDTLPLFLLAVMHLRKSVFLIVTFVAFILRCILFFVGAHLFFDA